VLFEAPHRIRALLALLTMVLMPDRRVVLARELTKKFEAISVHAARALPDLDAEERGEYVVLVDGAMTEVDHIDPSTERWLEALLQELPPARAAALAAKASGIDRNALYRRALQLKRPDQES
jgi:16S rRNA (cytidine1402-2'-O)-methyltransferase